MAYIINNGNVETVTSTTPEHGVRFRFENPCNEDGGHDYSEHVCPECGRDFCFACCGGTNVDHGGKYEEDYMICPACGLDIFSWSEEEVESDHSYCEKCGQTGNEAHQTCCSVCGASCGLQYGCGSDDCHTREPEVGEVIRKIGSRYDNLALIEADNGFFSEERVCLSDTCACNSHPRYWVRRIDRVSFFSMAESSVEANRLEDWDPSIDGPRYWDDVKYEVVDAAQAGATVDICCAAIKDGAYLEGGSMNQTHINFLIGHGACQECIEWAIENCKDLHDGWDKARPEWVIWMATRDGVLSDLDLHEFALWCANQVRHLMSDPRSTAALDAKRKWLDGKISDSDLDAAKAAAWDAARDAAWASAWDVARAAASDAAWAAAWASAKDVAWNAAKAAAWASAKAAAWASARDVAWASAKAAAWAEQADWLRKNTKPNFPEVAR